MTDTDRLDEIEIDDRNLPFISREVQQERNVAIYDLLQSNRFSLPDRDGRSAPPGPYKLWLGIQNNRLVFRISNAEHADFIEYHLSINPFRVIIKNYFRILDAYNSAVMTLPRHRIEAIDVARGKIHDEGADQLMEKLEGKMIVDHQTARRLFTLVCALQSSR